MTDRLDLKTPDGVSQNIERIAALFPHCVTETANDSGSATIGGATLSGTPNTALPLRIVFHDYAFANDTAKENVRQLLKQLSGETEMRVI